MFLRSLCAAALTGSLVAAACGGSTAPSAPDITLTVPGGTPAYVEVAGLSDDTLDALEDAELSPEQWSRILTVAVGFQAPPMLGRYSVEDRALRFSPAFPLDPGRQYQVRFDASHVPGVREGGAEGGGEGAAPPLVAIVGLPARAAGPPTSIARVYPSGDVVPENWLRMYVEFSGSMGRKSGVEYIRLLDQGGKEIEGALLPLDYEFWSPDHTRFTAFFDPGRVKRGILPNKQMGRPLDPGRSITLVISREWRDEYGQPLKEEYRRVLRVGPADEQPLDTAAWKIQPPRAGGREPVVVTFPEPLDHGLLMRALGVTREGKPVEGEASVEAAETRWTFTPKDPWRAGSYGLLALDILEDLAGNQIGRAFEVDNFDTVDKSPNPQTITLPFQIAP